VKKEKTDKMSRQSMQVCKSGWGAGLLYLVTRETRYFDWTKRLGDWFVQHQYQDGHWENTKFWTPNPSLADNIEVTAEFVMHMANIIGYLSVPA
jgi:squalene cyclase